MSRWYHNNAVKRLVGLGLAAVITTVGPIPRASVVDEVVAVIGPVPLLASDLDLAVATRLVPAIEGEAPEAYRSRVLAARIRLEIQHRDLESSGVLYRLRPDVDPVRDALVDRAGGDGALREHLDEAGLAMVDVDDLALRIASVDAYVTQRLRPRIAISLDDVESTYRELVVAEYEQRGATPPPIDEVRDDLYRLLLERRLNDEIERWTSQAEARLEVTVFAP
jgi:hypothetical protein